MALVLTCACGARFELDDALAGEQVPCPDCRVLVKAPDVPTPQPRTSYWALASTVLALTGAFTVVGTLAAIGCGIIGLIHILRQPDRVRGLGFALFGLIAGLLLTASTIFLLNKGLFVNWGDQMRETLLADQIDVTGPMLINEPTKAYTLTRPDKKWGKQLETDRQTDPVLVALNRTKADLTIVQPQRFAFVDVRVLPDQKNQEPQETLKAIVKNYADSNPDIRWNEDANTYGYSSLAERLVIRPVTTDYEVELVAVSNYRRWKIILRLCNRNGKDYLVRGFVQDIHSDGMWGERGDIKKAINSFKLKD